MHLKNHIVWIGGCSSQFKSVRAWYFVSQYPIFTNSTKNLRGRQLIWNFFATSHGKGEVDGAWSFLKHEVQKKQFKPKMGDIDRTRLLECFIMKGSCSKHQVCSLSTKDPTLY